MRFQKYIATAFLGLLLLPALSAKKVETPEKKEFDISTLVYIEEQKEIDLGFDTAEFLPEGFDPYCGELSLETINYVEDDEVDLGFDTAAYLPEGFNPYK